MNKRKTTKKSFIIAAVSFMLTVLLMMGATFAWFTASQTSGENVIKTGNFNPFTPYDGNRAEVIKNNLSSALAMTFDAYNLLDLVDFKGIIDNVILKGLPTVQSEILRKFEVNDEKSV